jgi:multidrug efflux pump subunit AcrA (membrane-fusion protein)
MSGGIVRYGLPMIAVAMLVFGIVHVVKSEPSVEKLAPPVLPPRSPYPSTVAAAGLVEPRSENIAVGSALSGVVLEVYVPSSEVGRFVRKGTPLFRVDDRHLQAQLRYQEANRTAAEAQLAKLEAMPRPEEVPPAEAKARAAEANQRMTQDQAQRAKQLLGRSAISQEEFVQRQLQYEMLRFQWEQARADLALLKAGAWQPDKEVSRASIALAKAQIDQTKTEIERATVRAPIDGHVLQVNVRAGEFVGAQPGQALMIMGDLSRYHVRVDIDEHDVLRFRPGAPARAYPRGHSEQARSLTFVRCERYVTPKKSLTGENTERVDTRVLQVIYACESGEGSLYVGQQLDVFIEASAPESPASPQYVAGPGTT